KHLPNIMWRHMLTMGCVADAVIVPSRHLALSLQESGIDTPVDVIPNGLSSHKSENYALLPPMTSGKLRILSVARHSPEKRVHILIEALYIASNLDAELILVGEGPTHSQLEELVARRKLGAKVRFMGNLSNAAVREIMRESDVLCLASYNFDNQPMVIIEALEAGLPIIYCDPNLKEGLTPSNSLLVRKQPSNFADAYEAVADKTTRKKMSSASRRQSANYRIEKIAERILKVYGKSLNGR
ncbi:glycosyltransferase, partial [Candidatus Saccharibacteria bacterium]|nr:glycosyltransferase [Candidatus Saccharibacteria bacterium]